MILSRQKPAELRLHKQRSCPYQASIKKCEKQDSSAEACGFFAFAFAYFQSYTDFTALALACH